MIEVHTARTNLIFEENVDLFYTNDPKNIIENQDQSIYCH